MAQIIKLSNTLKSFEDIKHIDEYGIEYKYNKKELNE